MFKPNTKAFLDSLTANGEAYNISARVTVTGYSIVSIFYFDDDGNKITQFGTHILCVTGKNIEECFDKLEVKLTPY